MIAPCLASSLALCRLQRSLADRGEAARAKAIEWLRRVGIPEPERRFDSSCFSGEYVTGIEPGVYMKETLVFDSMRSS